MSQKKTSPRISLDKAVEQFSRQYLKPGSGVSSVSKGQQSIRVCVSTASIAGQLPATFKGYPVHVYQDLGPAGEKAIIRDSDGKVVGSQG